MTCASPPSCSTTRSSPTRHADAKELLAGVYEKLGYGAENGTWRNFYLMGAQELRHGGIPHVLEPGQSGDVEALTVDQLIDSIAVRVDGPKAWSQALSIDWDFTDEGHPVLDDPVQRCADPLGYRPRRAAPTSP